MGDRETLTILRSMIQSRLTKFQYRSQYDTWVFALLPKTLFWMPHFDEYKRALHSTLKIVLMQAT